MKRKEVESCTILLTLTGSRLYGIDNSDLDYDYNRKTIEEEVVSIVKEFLL